ncbi:hypothetical protein [Nostoc sp. KVJ3]|uniref:hypothetical protein n=1 Tax=Nostoc sp. KVJ3 TaxID=457945 RepID=UPI002237A6DF|nr:hypothetical protein [Nostoc sp. KVJ3]
MSSPLLLINQDLLTVKQPKSLAIAWFFSPNHRKSGVLYLGSNCVNGDYATKVILGIAGELPVKCLRTAVGQLKIVVRLFAHFRI